MILMFKFSPLLFGVSNLLCMCSEATCLRFVCVCVCVCLCFKYQNSSFEYITPLEHLSPQALIYRTFIQGAHTSILLYYSNSSGAQE